MSETYPTVLRGTCIDCGTAMTLEHPNGIGGEGQAWPCSVCSGRFPVDGSAYIESGDPA